MNNILNKVSTFFSLITIILLATFNYLVNNTTFNGLVILIFLIMLLNPIANLCRLNKKIINNPIYHILLIIVSSFISCYSISSLVIYKDYLDNPGSEIINDAINCIGNIFIPSVLSIIFLLILQIFLRKDRKKVVKDNSKIMLLILIITCIIPFFSNYTDNIFMAFLITNLIFIILLIIKKRDIATTSDLQGYYIIIILMSLLSNNPIGMVLTIYLFLQLDTFGLNI